VRSEEKLLLAQRERAPDEHDGFDGDADIGCRRFVGEALYTTLQMTQASPCECDAAAAAFVVTAYFVRCSTRGTCDWMNGLHGFHLSASSVPRRALSTE